MMTPRNLLTTATVFVASLAGFARAETLLTVDLTVPDTATFTATNGLSDATAEGSNFLGIYLEDFLGASTINFGAVTAGDFVPAENTSDGSPELFSFGDDNGLNIWTMATETTLTFTAGSIAFTGSATYALDPDVYTAMTMGSTGGDVYFPADSADDIAGAVLLGQYEVLGGGIPEPSTVALSVIGLITLFGVARRR